MKKRANKILVCVPSLGDISTATVNVLVAWAVAYDQTSIGFFFPTDVAPVDRVRNYCVNHFLTNDYTHLFFVDSDTTPPVDALTKLLEANRDIISGITPVIKDRVRLQWVRGTNVFTKSGPVVPNGKVQEIERCGASCLLIKRRVFQKIKEPPFKFVYDDKHQSLKMGEDYYFCQLAQHHGFKIFCDTSIECGHTKKVPI